MARPPRHDHLPPGDASCGHDHADRHGRPGAEWAVRSWTRVHSRRALLLFGAAGVFGVLIDVPLSARADPYPSWGDVLKARANVKAKAKEIARIKALLERSRAAAEKAQQVAEVRGSAYQDAQARVETANERLATVQKQVAVDEKRAEEAKQRAGQLAAQLSRTGGADLETSLFFSSSTGTGASDFLSRLGRLSKLTESNGAIAEEAATAKNTAAATQAQLAEVKRELVSLKEKSRLAYQAAVQASEEANDQVQREQAQQVELQARLDALQANSDSLARRFQAGVAARKAAQQAGAGGAVTPGGWAKPAYGPITAGFGPRPDQPAGANFFHRGTDIGAGYGSPIYAAHAGTVVYAGWYGTYGNWIEIDNGGGISTGYAHIRPGGTFVRVGQSVQAGQNIASVGDTGAATGPHLHFETRIGEVAVDAVPFMAARGVSLG